MSNCRETRVAGAPGRVFRPHLWRFRGVERNARVVFSLTYRYLDSAFFIKTAKTACDTERLPAVSDQTRLAGSRGGAAAVLRVPTLSVGICFRVTALYLCTIAQSPKRPTNVLCEWLPFRACPPIEMSQRQAGVPIVF